MEEWHWWQVWISVKIRSHSVTLLYICPLSSDLSSFLSPLTLPHAPPSLLPSHRRPPVCDGDPLPLSSWFRVSQLPGPPRLGLLPPSPLLPSPPPHALRPYPPRLPPPHFFQSLTHQSCPLPGNGSLWPADMKKHVVLMTEGRKWGALRIYHHRPDLYG